jgi:hypothetical protein
VGPECFVSKFREVLGPSLVVSAHLCLPVGAAARFVPSAGWVTAIQPPRFPLSPEGPRANVKRGPEGATYGLAGARKPV